MSVGLWELSKILVIMDFNLFSNMKNARRLMDYLLSNLPMRPNSAVIIHLIIRFYMAFYCSLLYKNLLLLIRNSYILIKIK